MAIWKDLKIKRKTTPSYELIFTDKITGEAEDITDWTLYFTCKENMIDTDINAKIKKKITSHTDAKNGKSLITLDADDTDLESKEYYYSIDVKDNEGNVAILVEGRVVFEAIVLETKD